MAAVTTAGGTTSKRRRFQGPITNYFPVSNSESETGANLPSNHRHATTPATPTPLNPALPDKVQSSLLHVGMRVRKAVPEGYKTTEKPTKLAPHVHHAVHYPPGLSATTDSDPNRPAASELMPLCGMFKVGNLGMQTMKDERRNDNGFLTFDQESIDPAASSLFAPNPAKRGREVNDDSDDDDEDIFTQFYLPNTPDDIGYPPPQNRNPMRKILTPKLGQQGRPMVLRPAKWDDQSHQCGVSYSGQENQNPLPSVAPDFEDAVFLRRREEVDDEFKPMTAEVEMGGV